MHRQSVEMPPAVVKLRVGDDDDHVSTVAGISAGQNLVSEPSSRHRASLARRHQTTSTAWNPGVIGHSEVTDSETDSRRRRRVSGDRRSHAASDPGSVAHRCRPGQCAGRRFRAEPAHGLEASTSPQAGAAGHRGKGGRERLCALCPAPLQKAASWLEGYRVFWLRSLDS